MPLAERGMAHGLLEEGVGDTLLPRPLGRWERSLARGGWANWAGPRLPLGGL